MKPEATKNIAATFEAHPNVDELFANEYGHCFTKAAPGLTAVTRAQNKAALAALEKGTKTEKEADPAENEPAEPSGKGGKKGKK